MEINHLRPFLQRALEVLIKSHIMEKKRDSFAFSRKLAKLGSLPKLAEHEAATIVDALYKATYGVNGSYGAKSFDPYIVSFCSHVGDHEYERRHGLLSQWRGYGGAQPYAIVFDSKKLTELLRREAELWAYSLFLMADVKYGSDELELEGVFGAVIETAYKIWEEIVAWDGSDEKPDVSYVLSPFLSASTRIKHRGFREEREVRIILSPIAEQMIGRYKQADGDYNDSRGVKSLHVRDTKGRDVHYVKIFGNDVGNISDAVTRIIVGPSAEQANGYRIAREIAPKHIKITNSDTPYIG